MYLLIAIALATVNDTATNGQIEMYIDMEYSSYEECTQVKQAFINIATFSEFHPEEIFVLVDCTHVIGE